METAIPLYRPKPAESRPTSIDGVIAVDQYALQALVEAVGPLTLPGADAPVTGRTIIPYIQEAWNPEEGESTGGWWRDRKSFMGSVAQATMERVQSGQVEWGTLAKTMWQLLTEKHVMIYVTHPDAAALLAELAWDGSLRPNPASRDFLMVLDSNMGYNKVNARVRERITYEVDLSQVDSRQTESPPLATLTLVYTHTSKTAVTCRHEPHYGAVYEDMMNRCYWDYIRVYVPEGSELRDATRIPVPAEALLTGEPYPGDVIVGPAEEGPWLTFGVLGLVQPATVQTRHFTWTLPANVVEWSGNEGRYTLRVQKQPGTAGHPLTVRVRLPAQSTLLEAVPRPKTVTEEWVIYRTELTQDRTFELRFRRQE
jgi:hypothetical protein